MSSEAKKLLIFLIGVGVFVVFMFILNAKQGEQEYSPVFFGGAEQAATFMSS